MLSFTAFLLFLLMHQAQQDHFALDALKSAMAAHDLNRVHVLIESLKSGNEAEETLLAAGALLAQGDLLHDAATLFEASVQRYPASFEARYNLALTEIEMGDFTNATKTLDSISPVPIQHAAAIHYLWGKVESASANEQQALRDFEQAYQADPGNENYALDLALLEIRSFAYVPAIAVLRPAIASHPASGELKLELALALSLGGQRGEAVDLCHTLITEHTGWSEPYVIASFSRCMDSDFVACARQAEAGLRLENASPYLYYLQAEALWNVGPNNRTRVIQNLDIAIERMPECTACLMLRSRVREASHDDSGSLADVRTAIGQNPELASAWYRSATLCRKLGYEKEAVEALAHYRALRTNQQNDDEQSFRRQFVGSASNATSSVQPDH